MSGQVPPCRTVVGAARALRVYLPPAEIEQLLDIAETAVGVPFTVDLKAQIVHAPDGSLGPFEGAYRREMLLGGIDETRSSTMSARRSRGDRIADAEGRAGHYLDPSEAAGLARSYTAYAGPFEVDEARCGAPSFQLSLDPTLIGTLQERHVRLSDENLLERSVRSGESGLDKSTLHWRRAQVILCGAD